MIITEYHFFEHVRACLIQSVHFVLFQTTRTVEQTSVNLTKSTPRDVVNTRKMLSYLVVVISHR